MVSLYGRRFAHRELLRHIGRLEQIGGIVAGTYGEGAERGVRFLDIRSGGGLEARVMVDRGFDIGELRFDGLPLGWRSGNGFRAPGLHDPEEDSGTGLLRSMDGMMLTCGLDHVRGAAESSAAHFGPRRQRVFHPLHGRIGLTPAQLLTQQPVWRDDDCVLVCEGIVRQAMMYGETLELQRRIEVPLGGQRIEIVDVVRNAGHRRTPHMLLYHLNFGFPLLDRDTQLVLPSNQAQPDQLRAFGGRQDVPQDDAIDELLEVQPLPDEQGRVSVALVNPGLANGLGVTVEYDATTLPALQIWRHLGPGMNVLAIEPATNIAAPRADLERNRQILFLEPGQERRYRLCLSVQRNETQAARGPADSAARLAD